jgi:SNF2 family DNA or RNA helicase
MIALEANFDPATLLNADPLNIEEAPPVVALPAKPVDPQLPKGDLGDFEDVTNAKIRALLNIISGTPIKCVREEDLVLPNLLYGNDNRPVPEGTPRRTLVFASFDETLDNVKNELKARQIPCELLGGTYQQMSEIIRRFEREGSVLLVNSKHYCAGINLQFVTEVVFMHKINNEHCEQQVCGRAQRIGRKYNLVVHWICYENERA